MLCVCQTPINDHRQSYSRSCDASSTSVLATLLADGASSSSSPSSANATRFRPLVAFIGCALGPSLQSPTETNIRLKTERTTTCRVELTEVHSKHNNSLVFVKKVGCQYLLDLHWSTLLLHQAIDHRAHILHTLVNSADKVFGGFHLDAVIAGICVF